MKIPLIGPSYQSRSLKADAQRTMNLYQETVESGTGKNKQVLYGKPGIRSRVALGRKATAMVSLNGRLFVVSNNTFRELNSSFATVQTITSLADDPSGPPSWIIANGLPNFLQFLIVGANGACYFWQDGSGTTATSLYLDNLAGIVSTNNFEVNVTGDGDTFDVASMAGATIVIDGTPYTVDYVFNPYTLLLTSSAGVQTNKSYTVSNLRLNASSAAFLDGYAIVSRPSTRQFNISGLNDFLHWDPLDFALKEGYSDNIVRVLANAPELWLIGNETIEIWRNTGNPNFPFERDPSGIIHIGSSDPLSWVTIQGAVFGMCSNTTGGAVAMQFNGLSPKRISTHAVEVALKALGPCVSAFSYNMEGHYFWQLNWGTATWVYDATEGQWAERGLLNTGGSADTFFRDVPEHHTFIPEWVGARNLGEDSTFGSHIVSGNNDANLYEMSLDFVDDNSTAIRYVRAMPHICDEKKKLFWARVVLEMETGTAASGDPEPVMEFRISRDGGFSYGTKRTQGIGLNGDKTKRVIFRQNGAARDFVAEFACTCKAKMAVIDAYGEVQEGTL